MTPIKWKILFSLILAIVLAKESAAQLKTPTAAYDEACSKLTYSKVGGYGDQKEDEELIFQCSRHPDKSFCDAAKEIIEDGGRRSIPELKCGTIELKLPR